MKLQLDSIQLTYFGIVAHFIKITRLNGMEVTRIFLKCKEQKVQIIG